MYAPEVNMRVFPGSGSDAAQLALLRLAAVTPREDARPMPGRKRKVKGTWSFLPVEFMMFGASMSVFAGIYLWQNGRLEPWLRSAQNMLAQVGIR
jgi:heme/copper-type cytochrome/quinol oxidase subunit 3